MTRLIFLLVLFVFSCKNIGAPPSTVITSNYKDSFHYKNIFEDYIDTFTKEDIKKLFGNWSITDVAKIGGTLQSDSIIKTQIGKKLYIDNSKVIFDFYTNSKPTPIYHPKFEIEVLKDSDVDQTQKGTSYFHGYRMCRKNLVNLIISKQEYFEVVSLNEMTNYVDGFIFFLKKD